ncbi:ABC transporter substrate-binding protein [Eubacteriales bacterium OttesenSCG-928-K08]|nr:ABC transporter substrate-binding protein [Eubacteriales bacterium OttesenSCG-928-K08]
MKKTISFLLVLLLVLCGCNNQKLPVEENVVTVYVAHNADQYNAVVKEFQERTGIEVQVYSAGTGDCLERIAKEAENPQCDVMWGGTTESLEAYKAYFQPYTSQEDEAIPAMFKDPQGLWIGESQQPAVIMYNKRLLAQDALPVVWQDLLDPRYEGMIASADPSSSGSAYTLLCTMIMAVSQNPDYSDGWDFIRELYPNLAMTGSSSAVYHGVANGEYALGLTLEQLAWVYVGSDPKNIGMIYPQNGSSNVPDGVAMVKDCPHPEKAAVFIDFILSRECQQRMSDTAGRRSVRNDVEQPEGLPDLNDIYFLEYDFSWAGAGKESVIAAWRELIEQMRQ